MPVPQQRDPEVTRERLRTWLAARLPGSSDLEIAELTVPHSGFSTETLLFRAAWRTGRTPAGGRFAARVAGRSYQLYPEARLGTQCRLQRVLYGTGVVPVPRVHWFERDPAVLGAPFYVMEQVAGQVPADLPSYHREGWVAELDEPGRARLWHGGIEALSRLHALDVHALGLHFAALTGHRTPRHGSHLDHQLDYYERYLDHFDRADDPLALRTLAWLRAHRPPEPARPSLLWGDARLGNIIFSAAGRPAALLDWEMASLGAPETDLAWFLYLDRHLSEGIGADRLPGLPGRDETVARYEELSGRTVHHLDYYEVFAGFRLMLITARLTGLVLAHGMVPPGTDFPLARNTARLLARTLEGVRR
ncbi:phosphotransferase family protein [Streptomyces sp. NPDC048106]|uniref:phosphotransferase family protein n=1 Tax=Streptomyces sp. NPDC048106 TaxID=3155750 RepID=UPI003454F9A0